MSNVDPLPLTNAALDGADPAALEDAGFQLDAEFMASEAGQEMLAGIASMGFAIMMQTMQTSMAEVHKMASSTS